MADRAPGPEGESQDAAGRLARAGGRAAGKAAGKAARNAVVKGGRAALREGVKGAGQVAAGTTTGGATLLLSPRAWKIAFSIVSVVAVGGMVVVAAVAAVLIVGSPANAAGEDAGELRCTPSAFGKKEIPGPGEARDRAGSPVDLMAIYRSAADASDPGQQPLGDEGVWTLAAINSIESGFGENMGPSSAGAIGWMQFMPATWEGYGVDADNDGKRDPFDPDDAIHAAAKLLRANGAPGNWHDALFAYNHAEWYVDDVLDLADAYQGVCTVLGGRRPLEGVMKVTADQWLAEVPADLPGPEGLQRRCDSRILQNVIYLLRRFKLSLGDCYAPGGHSSTGEHPLGLAVDIWPTDGNWNQTKAAARFVGWSESCAARGCPNTYARWIGYNGVVNHGDPQNCLPDAAGNCSPHLHISWNHAPAAYNTQADWVMVWKLPGQGRPRDGRDEL